MTRVKERKITISGKKLSSDGIDILSSRRANPSISTASPISATHFEDGTLNYELTPDDETSGLGKMFSTSAAQALIAPHWDILRANNDMSADEKLSKVVATEIGREMLLMILSQRGCEGIRFYHAKRICNCGKVGPDPNADTLVAIGIDTN